MMKRLLLIMAIACFGLSMMAATPQKKATKNAKKVEVIYFHGKQRCPTCMAIEAVTKELVTTEYKNDKNVKFRVVDITTDEGKALAEKYKVSFSSLYVGKKNLTSEGFRYARNNPDALKGILRTVIDAQR